jgi:hypothetical protein
LSSIWSWLLAESKKEVMPNNLPPPNEGMFAVHYDRERGCYVKRGTAAEIVEFKHYDNRSVDYMPEEPYVRTDPKLHRYNIKKRRKFCYYKNRPIDDNEENKRKSCYYKAEPNPGQN